MKFKTLVMVGVALALGSVVLCSCQRCGSRRDVTIANPNDQSVAFRVWFRGSSGQWVESFPQKTIAPHGNVKECRIMPRAEERDAANELWIAEMNGKEIFRKQLSWHDLENSNFRIDLPFVR